MAHYDSDLRYSLKGPVMLMLFSYVRMFLEIFFSFLICVYGCFAYKYGYRVHAVPTETKEGVRSLALELLMVVRGHVCAGYCARVLWKYS